MPNVFNKINWMNLPD